MKMNELPPVAEMQRAFSERDASFDGVFYTAVTTTGVFCRPTCPARKPRPENVEFFPSARDALFAGYRPCLRCRPLEPAGATPDWLRPLIEEVEQKPEQRWTDQALRQNGLEPSRVRRWFKEQYGMTFHAYQRGMRLGQALGRLRNGNSVTDAAFSAGYESLSGFYDLFQRVVGGSPAARRDSPAVHFTRVLTSLGPMVAGATNEAVCLLEFADRRMLERQLVRLARRTGGPALPGTNDVLQRLEAELLAYFKGELRSFGVPLFTPGSEFQRAAWDALRAIPYGETRSYAQQAAAIGRPEAVRAVARANGDNRIAIVIPCHRVIGSDGQLTGYGGGLWRKRRLLELEMAGNN